nr:myb family transcription factor APL-like [Aegilops tauschii subsp. strangulata]
MQPTSSLLRWTDDLHKIFLEAVEYQGGPYEVKPTAVKEKMEAMGVTGLTIWNIKSHLQRYREKCNLGPEPPRDVRGTASPRKAGDNVTSETETVVDSDAATNLTEMEGASSNDVAAKATTTPHFVFVPLMHHGHLIPAVDAALQLATHSKKPPAQQNPSTTTPNKDICQQKGEM